MILSTFIASISSNFQILKEIHSENQAAGVKRLTSIGNFEVGNPVEVNYTCYSIPDQPHTIQLFYNNNTAIEVLFSLLTSWIIYVLEYYT